MQPDSVSSSGKRNFRSPERVPYPEYVDRWAIIVGISRYKNEGLNLRYADRDAEELYKLLLTPSGGGFEADHITKLINADASTVNVTRALRSFMKKPAREDIVLIYFACHGAPDPDKPSNIYLLTYETDPEDISGTAIPMREIFLSLKENLLAERIVIIADTCHSAAISGGGGRRSGNSAALVNRYMQRLSGTKSGTALLTSAEASEVSLEDEKWGGGHGVFTYYLLEGMRGEADYQPKDGIVTVGELFEYVRDNVQKATGNQQHPWIGMGEYDRNLPMAITGGITAQEHYQLGCQLSHLGWMLDDKRRFESAKGQFYEAQRLSRSAGVAFPETHVQLGLTLTALKDYSRAVGAFKAAMKQDKGKTLSDIPFHLGVAHAKMKNYKDAVTSFEMFLQQDGHINNSPWVREYVEWLRGMQASKKYTLLIGINEYADPVLPNLRGPLHDVLSMERVLIQRFGFRKENTITLLDNHATRQSILESLNYLTRKASQYDIVVIYYSGHCIPADDDDHLMVHDSKTAQDGGRWTSTITGKELHRLITRIPTRHKTVILDTFAAPSLLELAEKEGEYELFIAARPGEQVHEGVFGAGIISGAFTYSLIQQLSGSKPQDVTYGQIVFPVITTVHRRHPRQTPQFRGIQERQLFSAVDEYLAAFDFSQRKNYSSLTFKDLRHRYTRYRERITSSFPQMHYSFGRAFIEKGGYAEAIDALQTALSQCGRDYPESNLAQGFAQVGAEHYAEALASFQKYLLSVQSPTRTTQLQELIALVEKLARDRKYALLVGIDDYLNPEVPHLQGPVNDVRVLKRLLRERLEFQEENIKVLLNRDAARHAILEAFKQLLESARDEPALFYFAGNGSTDMEGAPTIVSVDGRQEEVFDIDLQELAALAGENTNLVTVIDAGWTHTPEAWAPSRTAPTDLRPKPGTRAVPIIMERRNVHRFPVQIGHISIYPGSITISEVNWLRHQYAVVEAEFPDLEGSEKNIVYGQLTYAFIASLLAADSSSLTYSQLVNSVSDRISTEPFILGNMSDQTIFSNIVLPRRILGFLSELDHESINETIHMLRRLIERRGEIYPEGYLNLGVAYAAKEDYTKSIEALKKAIVQQNGNSYPDAHYYLGRALFESKSDWAQAVSELRQAIEQDPDSAAAYYYLGQAIRMLVERETLVQAEQALQIYLEKGAPLGHEDEVEMFLASRKGGSQ